MRYDAILWNNHYAVANVVMFFIDIIGLSCGRNHDVIPDARIFVHNGVFNPAIGPDADPWLACFFVIGYGLM